MVDNAGIKTEDAGIKAEESVIKADDARIKADGAGIKADDAGIKRGCCLLPRITVIYTSVKHYYTHHDTTWNTVEREDVGEANRGDSLDKNVHKNSRAGVIGKSISRLITAIAMDHRGLGALR
ncbi:hypothetical protein DPMN_124127 [Dreissena polymorpha]|uniref:Uncharacterized protein n=1 Tax=Dreissena polymorpha TaxID=45954 RepID=A0A9D4JRX2_DREPO|nr:hypothetical protein DPMN_124127 [Dreissena polymorpha]